MPSFVWQLYKKSYWPKMSVIWPDPISFISKNLLLQKTQRNIFYKSKRCLILYAYFDVVVNHVLCQRNITAYLVIAEIVIWKCSFSLKMIKSTVQMSKILKWLKSLGRNFNTKIVFRLCLVLFHLFAKQKIHDKLPTFSHVKHNIQTFFYCLNFLW